MPVQHREAVVVVRVLRPLIDPHGPRHKRTDERQALANLERASLARIEADFCRRIPVFLFMFGILRDLACKRPPLVC